MTSYQGSSEKQHVIVMKHRLLYRVLVSGGLLDNFTARHWDRRGHHPPAGQSSSSQSLD